MAIYPVSGHQYQDAKDGEEALTEREILRAAGLYNI